jgi:hypothetical protein
MRLAHKFVFAASAAMLFCGATWAQNAISAKAGMINVIDGDAFLLEAKGGAPIKVEPKLTEFINVKEGQVLKTTEGRAEILLNSGSCLRLWDESSFKLISSRISDARLEVLSGSALIEVMQVIEGNEISVLLKDATVTLTKGGIFRFEANPARIRVQMGEALVDYEGQQITLKSGKQLTSTANGWVVDKFEVKESDALLRWSKRRASYMAMASVSSARQATPRNGFQGGSWMWNPYFGFATYIPYGDTLRSPFGYYYYTPSTVMAVYFPPRGNGGWAGGGNGGGSHNVSNGFASSMPSRSAGYSSYSGPSAVSSAGSVASSGSVSSGASHAGAAGGGGVSAGAASAGRGGSAGGRGN